MKKFVCLAYLVVMMFNLSVVALGDSFEIVTDNGEMITVYEPEPYQGESLQERFSFMYICVSPDAFTRSIKNAQSEDAIFVYLQGLGLPVEYEEASYVYYYRNRMKIEEFALPEDNRYSRIVSVSYIYSKEDNDNYVFVFVEENGEWYLIDGISSFGDIRAMIDSEGKNVWLTGYNGVTNRTVRWYHLQSTTVVFAYLEQGVWADSPKYHVFVETNIELPENGGLRTNAYIKLCKRVSVCNIAEETLPDAAQRTVDHIELEQYIVSDHGSIDFVQASTLDAPSGYTP